MIPGQFKRSGGPQTAAGKLTTSTNAVSMGAYAKHVILPGEDEAQFNDLLDRLMDEYEPDGILESSLVRDIATHIWRKIRIERLESAYFLNALYQEVSPLRLSMEVATSDFAPRRNFKSIKKAVIDDRIYSFVLNHNTQRPIEDINRSLFKVMNELRRQQAWRIEKRAVLIEQEKSAEKAGVTDVTASESPSAQDVERAFAEMLAD